VHFARAGCPNIRDDVGGAIRQTVHTTFLARYGEQGDIILNIQMDIILWI